MAKKVKAFAPATVANLNVGFDVMGMALSSIGDTVEVTVNDGGKDKIINIVSDIDLPYETHKNSCSVVIDEIRKKVNGEVYVDIVIEKGFNAGSGLGSSAASSVAAGFAYNHLLGNPLSQKDLLDCCAEGERVACGSPIYDNISPALYGGLTMVNNSFVYSLPFPKDLWILTFFQKIEIKTEEARAILPKAIPTQDAIQQLRNISAFVHALHTDNLDLLQHSFQDRIAEPYRRRLIPNFDIFEKMAHDNDAIAFGISGSGPTVFSIVKSKETAEQLSQAFKAIADAQGLDSLHVIESLNTSKSGARLVETK